MSCTADPFAPRLSRVFVIRLALALILAVMAVYFLADIGVVLSGAPAEAPLGTDLCGFHALAALLTMAAVAFGSGPPRAIPRRRSPPTIIHPPA